MELSLDVVAREMFGACPQRREAHVPRGANATAQPLAVARDRQLTKRFVSKAKGVAERAARSRGDANLDGSRRRARVPVCAASS